MKNRFYTISTMIIVVLLAVIFIISLDNNGENSDSVSTDMTLASLGNVNAMCRIGESFEKERYYLQAVSWYEKAADNGSAEAMFKLGRIYMEGHIWDDAGLAADYFRRSAECGSKQGQSAYGLCLYYGIGAKEDRESGLYWMKKSASQGDKMAAGYLHRLDSKDV